VILKRYSSYPQASLQLLSPNRPKIPTKLIKTFTSNREKENKLKVSKGGKLGGKMCQTIKVMETKKLEDLVEGKRLNGRIKRKEKKYKM
jgi:hypothetical protein